MPGAVAYKVLSRTTLFEEECGQSAGIRAWAGAIVRSAARILPHAAGLDSGFVPCVRGYSDST